MKHRTKRIWIARLAIASAVVLVALTVYSGWYSGGYTMQAGSRIGFVGFGNGLGVWGFSKSDIQVPTGGSLQRFDPRWEWWFSIARTPNSYQMLIPLWAPTLGLILVAFCAWPKRIREGACASCGYELEGLKDPACPECGATILHD